MDPVTHAVIGLAVSKITGAGSFSDPSVIGLIAGAVIPDIDIFLQKWGDYVYLKNHRGATHSFPGLAASAAFAAFLLKMVFPGEQYGRLLLCTLLGCISHTLADLLNLYGARLFWPICRKKFSFGLLTTFDPVFIISLAGYYFMKDKYQFIFLGAFAGYMVFRLFMRMYVKRSLCKKYRDRFESINVLPSASGFFRWHFILSGKDSTVIGKLSILNGRMKIQSELKKPQAELDEALFSPVGSFFSDFTPFFHVAVEKIGLITRYIFIDLRYYIRDNFLHHAVLEIDEQNGTVRETFNPYSMSRCNIL